MAARIAVLDGSGRPLLQPLTTHDDDRAGWQQVSAEARNALEDAVVAATVAAQRALTSAAVLEEALAALENIEGISPGRQAASATAPLTEALSPREREVLAFVAEGRSNKAIAAALFVSPNTVKTHVASLLSKLRADSRVQLAAMATTRGFILAPRAAPR